MAAGIEWILAIDLNEFTVITRHDNFVALVETLLVAVSQVLLNWRLYGSGGELAFDATRTHFEKFTRHAPLNHHAHRIGKACFRVVDVRKMNLHLHEVAGLTVDGDLEELRPAAHPHGGSRPAFGIGWLAHFSVRSRAEFEEKAARGYPDDWHGKFPGEAYWTRRNLNDAEGPDLSGLAGLINARLAAWKTGANELGPAVTSIETGRLRKVDPEMLPKVPQSVALWRVKAVLEIRGKFGEIEGLLPGCRRTIRRRLRFVPGGKGMLRWNGMIRGRWRLGRWRGFPRRRWTGFLWRRRGCRRRWGEGGKLNAS